METLANDFVINRARARFPWGANILPPSPPTPVYSGKHGGLGHEFVASYLMPLNPRIRNQILDVAATLNGTCVAPPIACDAPVYGFRGGTPGAGGARDYVLSIGNQPQTVKINAAVNYLPTTFELFAGTFSKRTLKTFSFSCFFLSPLPIKNNFNLLIE